MTEKSYRVYMAPLIQEMTYGDEIEISDYVNSASVGNIRKNTDSDDYVIGEYLLGSVDLTCANFNGEFNENDPRSFFPYKRDQAKIRIEYFSDYTTSTISFKGIVNDEGTGAKTDDDIKLKVLALESVLRKVQVSAGAISAGDLFSDAIKAILNKPAITAVLTYSAVNIDVDLDLTIDDAGFFANISTWESLKQILIASNSVVYIDNETIQVRPRDYDTGEISYFFGPGDTLDRENIVNITDYNNGAHRIFNSIVINDTTYSDSTSVSWFGLKQKSFTLDFITDADKETIIARRLVDQFRYPRIEFQMTVPTDLANMVDFFDTVGVDHPIRSRPCAGKMSPIYGSSKYGASSTPYPVTFGGIVINGAYAFQMIQRTENVKDFTTTIKLRQRGKTFDDGVLIFWQAVYGFSIYGTSTY